MKLNKGLIIALMFVVSSHWQETLHLNHLCTEQQSPNSVLAYSEGESSGWGDVVFPFTPLGIMAAGDVIPMTVSYDSNRTSVQGEIQIAAHY